jgi:hypothetical protein
MNIIIRTGRVVALAGMLYATAAAESVFIDHFANNVVMDSDFEKGFWSIETQLDSEVSETGGRVMIAAGNGGAASVRAALQSAVQKRFDFFNPVGLTFSAELDLSKSTEADQICRFYLGNNAGQNLNNTDSYFLIQVAGDGALQIRQKTAGGDAVLLKKEPCQPGSLSGFRLHLDNQSYTLDLISGGQTNSYCGQHGLDPVKWGHSGSSWTFNSQLGSAAPPDAVAVMNVSRFAVTDDPVSLNSVPVSPVVQGGQIPEGLLVSNGKAYATLVIPAGADSGEKYAAKDLQEVLYKISGVRLPIEYDTSNIYGNRILIGRTRFTGGIVPGSESAALGEEEYIVRSKGRDLALAGGGPYGTIYAAAELYDMLGARWYMPGELGECLPKLNEMQFPELNIRRSPSFAMRWIGDDEKWNLRNRQNRVGTDALSPAFVVKPGIYHTQRSLMPDRYFDTHPEYFALVDDCRSTNAEFRKLCNSNPDVASVLAQNMTKLLRENPKIDLISLSPTDGQLWCECEKCRALDEPGIPGDQRYSRRQIVLYNRVAEHLEQEFPNQQILVGAYNTYTWPPADPSVTAHHNLAVIITHYEPYCMAHSVNDPACDANRRYLELINRWRKQTSHLYIYEYYFKANWMGLPWPVIHSIRDDISFYHSLGVEGLFSQYTQDILWGDFLAQYVGARLLWDHTADVNKILEEFYPKFYGEAAVPMEKYHKLLEAQMAASPVCFDGNAPKNWQYVFTEEVLQGMRSCITEAQKLATNEVVQKRIVKMEALTGYTEKFIFMLKLYKKAKASSGAEAIGVYCEALTVFHELDRQILNHQDLYEGIVDRKRILYRPMMVSFVAMLEKGTEGEASVIHEDAATPDDQRLN